MGCPSEVQPGSTLGMIARYCKPPEIFDLSDCGIRRSYLAKLFLHIHSPIFNSHGSACSWVITSHSSSLHPVGNRTWTKSSMIRKHKKNAEQYSLTFHLPKGHLICPAWAAKSILPKVLCRDIIRSEYPWQQSSDSEEPSHQESLLKNFSLPSWPNAFPMLPKIRNAVGRSAKITSNMSSMTSTAQLALETFLDAHASLLATFLEATKLPASCINVEEILYLCKRPKNWIFVCLSRVARITNTTTINWQLSIFCLWSEKAQHNTHSLLDRQDATPNRIQQERKTKSLHSHTTTISSSCPYGRNTSKYGKSS